MPNQTRRLNPAQLAEDKEVFEALQGMVGYAPTNPDYSLAAISQVHSDLEAAQAVETQAAVAADAARDDAVALEWEHHNRLLGAKDQVIAQFGRNSNQVQSLKLKKKEERQAPTRRKKIGAA